MRKLVISIFIVLLLAAVGIFYYYNKLNTYDLSKDAKLEKVAEDEYEVILPDENTGSATEPTKVQEGSSPEKIGEGNPIANEEVKQREVGEGQHTPEATHPSTEKPTVHSIKEKYRPSFENLESQANAKIQSVLSIAINEFKQKKANGEDISISYFLSKYKTAADSLETKTDQAFETIYAALQADLKANGYNLNEAEDVRSQYEAAKKQRRNALLAKAMEKL